jgi:hypothetical protein
MVAVIGALVVFVPLKAAILPTPLAPKPIAVFEFVHANVDPVTLLLKAVAGTVAPLQ